jgi:hypothetical protein
VTRTSIFKVFCSSGTRFEINKAKNDTYKILRGCNQTHEHKASNITHFSETYLMLMEMTPSLPLKDDISHSDAQSYQRQPLDLMQ